MKRKKHTPTSPLRFAEPQEKWSHGAGGNDIVAHQGMMNYIWYMLRCIDYLFYILYIASAVKGKSLWNYTSFGQTQAENARMATCLTVAFLGNLFLIILISKVTAIDHILDNEFAFLCFYIIPIFLIYFFLKKRYDRTTMEYIIEKYKESISIRVAKIIRFFMWMASVVSIIYFTNIIIYL